MGLHFAGQPLAERYCKKALIDKKTHAFLFVGKKGVGKRKAAVEFAAALCCVNDTSKPCGVCRSCKMGDKNPDITIIQPTGNTIKIGDIRALKEGAIERPFYSLAKVYIIDGGDKMTLPAANSFLKLLEEPPKGVYFIIISDTMNLLDTILSRVAKVPFFALSKEAFFEFFQEEGYDEEALLSAYGFGRGDLQQGALFLKDEGMRDGRRVFLSLAVDLTKGKKRDKGNLFLRLEGLEDWKGFLAFYEGFLRDLIIYTKTKDKTTVINGDLIDEIIKLSKDENNGERLLPLLIKTQQYAQMGKENANTKAILMALIEA